MLQSPGPSTKLVDAATRETRAPETIRTRLTGAVKSPANCGVGKPTKTDKPAFLHHKAGIYVPMVGQLTPTRCVRCWQDAVPLQRGDQSLTIPSVWYGLYILCIQADPIIRCRVVGVKCTAPPQAAHLHAQLWDFQSWHLSRRPCHLKSLVS